VTAASVPATPELRAVGAAPRWVQWVTLPLAVLGLGLAVYLTITHLHPGALVCNHGAFNCSRVTTSGESRFLGIPVAYLGLAQYVAMIALCTPWAWRSPRREVHLARLVLASVGMAFVLWLVTAEALIIKAFCEYCSGVHVVTFALFICVVATVPTMLGWTEER
jgi:uncharacterized membrane protein